MAYTENKKINALTQVTVPMGDSDNMVVEQSGVAKRATLTQLIAKFFNITTNISPTVTSDSAVVIRQDGSLGKAPLNNLVPNDSVTNAQINSAAAIEDTKLATIGTAGKVTNNAVQATHLNTAGRIVARDSNGDFAARNVTADNFTGTASSATNITGGAIGNVLYQSASGTTAKLANGALTANKFLMSQGENQPPIWASFTSTTASADNLNGGAIGAIPYQASVGSTAFRLPGTSGAVLTTNGTGQNPSWTDTSSSSSPNAIVKRDGAGNFAGAKITATEFQGGSVAGTTGSFTGNLSTGGTLTATGAVTASSTLTATGLITANGGITVPVGQTLTVSGTLTGNASTATKLNSTRTFALTGPVTGTVSSDLTSGATIATAITDGAVGPAKLSGQQSGSAPVYGCRAWVNFNGTAGNTIGGEFQCTINGSGNVTKVVRVSTGIYNVFLTTDMQNTSYCVVVTASFTNTGEGWMPYESATQRTASGFQVRVNDNAGRANSTSISVAVFQ